MSEFECRNGHMMPIGARNCSVCGEAVYTMDGMTGSQLRQQELEDIRDSNDYEEGDDLDEEIAR